MVTAVQCESEIVCHPWMVDAAEISAAMAVKKGNTPGDLDGAELQARVESFRANIAG